MRRAWLLPLLLAITAFAADFNEQPKHYPFHFIVYGDIRFTTPSNTQVSDPVRRKLIVKKIADEKPAFLAITGDIAFHGNNPADWQQFAEETKPLRDAHVELFPTIGNHDLYLDPQLVNYFKQFPELGGKRWYTVQYGNCFFFMLDSSADLPGGAEHKWLEEGLEHIPDSTQFVFFLMHHPPITQSHEGAPGGGHSSRPGEQQLAHLIEQAHTRTGLPMFVLAGHVHNYERYERNGVSYIVTGGGGATPYDIMRNPNDFYREAGPTYHFTSWRVDKDKLRFEMVKLEMKGDKPDWKVRDSFEVKATRAFVKPAGK